MVIECDRNNLSLPPFSLSHGSPPLWRSVWISTWFEGWSAKMNVNYLKCLSVNRLTDASRKIKVKAVFDGASIFSRTPRQKPKQLHCRHVSIWVVRVCADVNPSKGRGLRDLQFRLTYLFFHIFGVMYTPLSTVSCVCRLVNQLSQQLSCKTFNKDECTLRMFPLQHMGTRCATGPIAGCSH